VVGAVRRVAGDVGLLVRIRRLILPHERDNSDSDRYFGGHDDLIDNSGAIDDDHLDTSVDNHVEHDNIDEYIDHHDSGSIVGHRNSCHRRVGAGS
jgi:hypothetical protein